MRIRRQGGTFRPRVLVLNQYYTPGVEATAQVVEGTVWLAAAAIVPALAAAQSMNEVVDIPIIADCDSGFGDASIVERMVAKYEAAGIAAVCIEDKKFPKMNSFVGLMVRPAFAASPL